MSKERLEEIMDAIAYLRDEYVDAEMVSEYYRHDITAEIASCPTSALSYTGDYIELLQKRVQELEELIAAYHTELSIKDNANKRIKKKNKLYREALEFYADKDEYYAILNLDDDKCRYGKVYLDEGRIAREELDERSNR